jgi:hypothetical protein
LREIGLRTTRKRVALGNILFAKRQSSHLGGNAL